MAYSWKWEVKALVVPKFSHPFMIIFDNCFISFELACNHSQICGFKVNIFKSTKQWWLFSICYLMIDDIHLLNWTLMACFNELWNVMFISCNSNVQLVGTKMTRTWGWLISFNPRILCFYEHSNNQLIKPSWCSLVCRCRWGNNFFCTNYLDVSNANQWFVEKVRSNPNNAFHSSIIWWWEKTRYVACKYDLKREQESSSCGWYHDCDLSLVIHPKNFDVFLAFDFPSSFTYSWDKVDSCFIIIITNEKGML